MQQDFGDLFKIKFIMHGGVMVLVVMLLVEIPWNKDKHYLNMSQSQATGNAVDFGDLTEIQEKTTGTMLITNSWYCFWWRKDSSDDRNIH